VERFIVRQNALALQRAKFLNWRDQAISPVGEASHLDFDNGLEISHSRRHRLDLREKPTIVSHSARIVRGSSGKPEKNLQKMSEKIDTTNWYAHNPLRSSNASQLSPVLQVPLSGSSVRVYEN
jgi:hypothetical protein